MNHTAARTLVPELSSHGLVRLVWPIVWAIIALGPLVALAMLYAGFLPDPFIAGSVFHFYVVTGTSAIVLTLAIVMRVAAGQLGDPRALFLSLAFLCISAVFLVHALTTPGMLVDMNPWVGLSAGVSPFLCAAFLVLSTFRWSPAVRSGIVNHQCMITIGVACALGMFAAFALATSVTNNYPGNLPDVLMHPSVGHGLIAATSGLLAYVIGRYIWIYRSRSSPLVAGILISAIFVAQSQISITFAPIWHMSWWLYHLLLLAGFSAALVTTYVEYARHGSMQSVVGGLLLRDSMVQLQRGYTDVIVALIEAVEAKDPYTRGHTQRVAELSELIGEQVGLTNEEHRILNQAAVLHDIGKIGIPDSILNKPGSLTEQEFDLIKEHPVRGDRMIQHVRALQREAEGVRYHHERLDGSGYPDGLTGEEIPLIARIIAVADVFDALTSARPYRTAFAEDEAIDIILSERGTKLDPACVDALLQVLPVWSGNVQKPDAAHSWR